MNNVRGIRKARVLTLDDVSVATGIDRGHLSRIERGFTRPTVAVQETLAGFFGLPAFFLFPEGGRGQEKRA